MKLSVSTVFSAGAIAAATMAHAAPSSTTIVNSNSGNVTLEVPIKVEVDLHFPRNQTYADVPDFPLVFGIKGAEAAWRYGWFLDWSLYTDNGLRGISLSDTGSGRAYRAEGDSAPSDPYYMVNSTAKVKEGRWKLIWEFGFENACEGNASYAHFGGGIPQISDSLNFTVVAKGNSTGKPVTLLNSGEDCGKVGGVITVDREIFTPACPDILGHGDFTSTSKTCASIPEKDMASVSSMLPSSLPTATTSSSTGAAMPMKTAAPMLAGMAGVLGAAVLL